MEGAYQKKGLSSDDSQLKHDFGVDKVDTYAGAYQELEQSGYSSNHDQLLTYEEYFAQYNPYAETSPQEYDSGSQLDPCITDLIEQIDVSDTRTPESEDQVDVAYTHLDSQAHTRNNYDGYNYSSAINNIMDPYSTWTHAQQQYQQAIQFALQNPKLGPLQWPGGYHPQHTHALTYSKIFVGGLKRDTDRKTLTRYFSKFGPIKRVDLVMDPRNPGKNRGFAFVQFEHIEGCERACNRGQFHNLEGHDVEVKRAVLKPPGSGPETAGITGIDPTAYGYGMMSHYYGANGQAATTNGMQPASATTATNAAQAAVSAAAQIPQTAQVTAFNHIIPAQVDSIRVAKKTGSEENGLDDTAKETTDCLLESPAFALASPTSEHAAGMAATQAGLENQYYVYQPTMASTEATTNGSTTGSMTASGYSVLPGANGVDYSSAYQGLVTIPSSDASAYGYYYYPSQQVLTTNMVLPQGYAKEELETTPVTEGSQFTLDGITQLEKL